MFPSFIRSVFLSSLFISSMFGLLHAACFQVEHLLGCKVHDDLPYLAVSWR